METVKRKVDEYTYVSDWKTTADLLSSEFKDIPKLWDPFFPKTGIVSLVGSSDCGKSTLARNLAINIVLGKPSFAGFPINAEFGKAYYISTEDDEIGIASNMHKQIGIYPELMEDGNLKFLFGNENIIGRLNKALHEEPADLVIIDTFGDILSHGSINNLQDVRSGLHPYRTIARDHKCLILFIHHLTKNSEKTEPDKNRVNGSQAYEAAMRCVLELRNGSNSTEKKMSILKANHLPTQVKSMSYTIKFNEDTLTYGDSEAIIKESKAGYNARKYQAEEWVQRMTKMRMETNASYDDCYKQLKKQYSGESMPGLTWFKTNKGDCNNLLAG